MRNILLATILLASATAARADEYCTPLRSLAGLHTGDTMPLRCQPDFDISFPAVLVECRVTVGRVDLNGPIKTIGWDDCHDVRPIH